MMEKEKEGQGVKEFGSLDEMMDMSQLYWVPWVH